MSTSLMIVIVVVLIVLVLTVMVALLMGGSQKSKKRTLSVIRGQSVGNQKESDDAVQNKRWAEIAKKLKDNGEKDRRGRKLLEMRLQMAGLSISAKQFWIYSAILAAFVLILTVVMGFSPFVILMAGITALLGVPRLVLRDLIKRRQKKFLSEFADALEAMVRLLKAGMPVSEAILMASKEFSGPVGEEMSRIYDAQKIGIPLAEAAMDGAERMPLTEMQMFATGIAIQAQTGASLSEVLTNLAGVIRARFRLKRKVQALTSEAKSSAMIIGALPFVVGGGIYFINKDYVSILYTDPTGKMLLAGAAIWMGLGVLVMKIMINFKV